MRNAKASPNLEAPPPSPSRKPCPALRTIRFGRTGRRQGLGSRLRDRLGGKLAVRRNGCSALRTEAAVDSKSSFTRRAAHLYSVSFQSAGLETACSPAEHRRVRPKGSPTTRLTSQSRYLATSRPSGSHRQALAIRWTHKPLQSEETPGSYRTHTTAINC
jgi:hypothetical protein